MEKLIFQYAPKTWDHIDTSNPVRRVLLRPDSAEYLLIQREVQMATTPPGYSILQIQRFQSSFDYGQLLIREQLIINLFNYRPLYRVRRFVCIESRFLQVALEYNLDYRRCGLGRLCLRKHLQDFHGGDKVILVVQVLTPTPNSEEIIPENSSDYYIEYIVV
ncbi:unnamed protein product [Phyllotreta striolata]|uniref:Uncharacterized protein n=1 Tax=Phyllotreta striolata TaxID=444603 RepID=A0A9N9TS88_PHYSR|nr:unnamed protein product [Phyllotreta striolata]